MDINGIKKETGARSLEYLLALAEQPEFSCPAIDNIDDLMHGIEKAMESQDIHRISFLLKKVHVQLEHIRKANIGLRSFGAEWKRLACALLNRHPETFLRYVPKDDHKKGIERHYLIIKK